MNDSYSTLAIILGNCLFPKYSLLEDEGSTLFYMAESYDLCTHFKYHKHKIILFLSAMRSHADQVSEDYDLVYNKLTEDNKKSYMDMLEEVVKKYSIKKLKMFDIEDKFFFQQISQFADKHNLDIEFVNSPGFITSQKEFQDYVDSSGKKLLMQNFYIQQRKKLSILVTEQKKPVNGKWSFDEENRKKLPKKINLPDLPSMNLTDHTKDIIQLVDLLFEDHIGSSENFYLPTTRQQAFVWLYDFFKVRFEKFGPYEDAIDSNETFLFHSVLSPLINLGLLTPQEVVDKALDYYHENDVHFSSVEGFIRQIIGWREFIRGVYNTKELEGNHFNHKAKLRPCWYDGTTGITPLDDTIKKAVKYAYTHHIERLMVVGNIMLLCRVDPDEVYRWFMELYVDSSDWVMVPNVYGMSQFADGGTFATKPYIAGSNYIKKMSNYGQDDWCEVMDGLYWSFVDDHRDLFSSNPRMAMMTKMLDKMDDDKRKRIFDKAKKFRDKVTS